MNPILSDPESPDRPADRGVEAPVGGPDEFASERSPHRIVRKLAYLLSARWVREILQSVFLIYLARLSASTFGEFTLALSIGQMLLFIAEFGLDQHLVPLLAQKKEERSDVLMQFTFLKIALLIVGWLGMYGFIVWQGYSPSLQALVMVIGTGVGLEAVASSFFVALEVQGRQDVEGKLRTLGATLGFGYGLTALFLGAAPLIAAFYKLIETLSNLGSSVVVVLRHLKLRLSRPRFGEVWATGRGSAIFTLMAVATILYNKANMFFLQQYAGSEGVAQYGATWQIVDGVSVLASNVLLRNILFPLFVNLWETDREELTRVVRHSARLLLAAALPIMFALFVESDRIIGILYGSGYGDSIWMQKYLVVTIGFAFIHNLAGYLMLTIRKERLLLGFYIFGLAFNLALCMLLIPGNPLEGTVLAIILTKGIVAVMTVSYCQRRFGLISLETFLKLIGAVAVGGCLYLLVGAFGLRLAAEILALAPILFLLWRFWKETPRKAGAVTG